MVDSGKAIWLEDLMLPMQRAEAQEEGYFTFTHSPIRDETGAVGGVLCAVVEMSLRFRFGGRARGFTECLSLGVIRWPQRVDPYRSA
jgi:hypothetical protein